MSEVSACVWGCMMKKVIQGEAQKMFGLLEGSFRARAILSYH